MGNDNYDVRSIGKERRGTSREEPNRLSAGRRTRIFSQKAEFKAEMPQKLQPRVLVLNNFDFNKATVRPEHLKAMNDLTKDLLETSKQYENRIKVRITLEGHTDNVGTREYNINLGMRRAQVMKEQLQGLLNRRLGNLLDIKVSSKGKDQPVASNDTAKGRALNRRVEVRVEVTLLRAPAPKKKPKPIPPKPNPEKKTSKACEELKRMSWFASTYYNLRQAARDSELNIDRDGNLTFLNVPSSYLKILSGKTQEDIESHLLDKLKFDKNVMFKKHFLPVVAALGLLNDIRAIESDRQLVGGVGKKWEEKRYRKKLSMYLDIMANDRYKNLDPVRSRGTTPGTIKLKLWRIYKRYEKLTKICVDKPGEEARINKPSR